MSGLPSRAIESTKNALIKSIVELHRSTHRRERGQFLIEGTHLLSEAIATGWPIDTVLCTDEWAQSNKKLLQSLGGDASVMVATERVLEHVATTECPDGVVCLARMQPPLETTTSFTLGLGLEQLQDPGNLGTLIRSAVAAEADRVFLSERCVDATNPKVLRSSAGQWFRRPPQTVAFENLVDDCRQAGVQVLAAAANGVSYWQVDFKRPTLILLGNEGSGLSKTMMDRADSIVSVPMSAGVESLNVAMTGTLLLYEAMRQRRG